MDDPLADLQRGFTASALQSMKRDLRYTDALVSVHNALGRPNDAGFARCSRCDAGIPFDRLAAEAQARYCLACRLGLQAGCSSNDVGDASTYAAVMGIVGIIVFDALFAACANAWGF